MMMKKISNSIPFLLCLLAAILLLSVFWLENKFGIVSIDSILFHLQYPLDKTPISYPLSFLKRILSAFVIAGLWALCFKFKPFQKPRWRKALLAFPYFFLAGSLIFAANKFELIAYLKTRPVENKILEEHYFTVNNGDIKFPAKKRNVVVIFLESMEMNFADKKMFPVPLIPKLDALRNGNLHCDLRHSSGLTWTVASLTGFIFGLPLRLPIEGNSYNSASNYFLPGAPSILEVFERNGYNVNLISGSDSRFGGVDNIFINHLRSPGVYDSRYFTREGVPAESAWGWGLRDKTLYQQAQALISGFSREEAPFFVLIQSIDTHSEALAYGDYPRPFGDPRDSFIAADHMAAEFLDWLAAQDFYAETTVLIVGDHLYMGTELGTVALEEDRSPLLYNVFLNTVFDGRPEVSKRAAVMWDMGASLLEAVGAELPEGRFGLGVSIFSDRPTLAERFDAETLASFSRGKSAFYEKFFSPPALALAERP